MKKLSALVMTFVLIITVFSVSVSAKNSQTEELSENVEFRNLLIECFENCADSVDVEKFNLYFNSDEDNAAKFVNDIVFHTMPLYFNVATPIRYSYNSNKKIITKLSFTYKYSKEENVSRTKLLEAKSDSLLLNIKGNNSLTDVQKALLIHDRLIENCEYCVDDSLTKDANNHIYDAYGAIVNGKAVCEGYTLAYMYLLNQVGIKSRFCSSAALGHAWNIVTIGGKEYHIDTTWDDPLNDITGNVCHDNFLCSSEKFKTNHKKDNVDIDYDTTPNDTTYDNEVWNNSISGFQYVSGNIYYIDHKSQELKKWNLGADDDVLADVEDSWKTSTGGTWKGNFARLSTDGEYLYYNLSTVIDKYDLSSSKSTLLHKPDLTGKNGYNIFGFMYKDGYLIYELSDTPNYEIDTKEKTQVRFLLSELINNLARLIVDGDDVLYYNNGLFQNKFIGMVMIDDVWYYIVEGKVAFDRDVLIESEGTVYHANHGIINTAERPLIFKLSETEMFYIDKGMKDINFTGLFDFEGNTYYVVEGDVYYGEEISLLKLDDINYCIRYGIVDKTVNGSYKSEETGIIYDIENGIATIHTKHTGGRATCNSKAICSICDEEYGEYDPDVHTFEDKLQGKCSNCSYVRYKNLTLVDNELYLFDSSSGELDDSVQIRTTNENISNGDRIIFLKGQNICFVNGVIPKDETFVNYGGYSLYIQDGVFYNNNGVKLISYEDKLYYCYNGVHYTDVNGAIEYKGEVYIVTDGIASLHSTHKWNNGVITKKATCTAEGTKKLTCLECGTKEDEIIPKVAHNYQTTWTKDGTYHYHKCANCSACKDKAAHSYTNKVTQATFSKNGAITPTCTCGAKKTATVINKPDAVVYKYNWEYTGKAILPSVKVTDANNKTISKTGNYDLTYKNNTNIGKATITIKFKGNYSGTQTFIFAINKPTIKATTISKVTSAKKGFKVTWKKQSVTGYEIQYATNANFKSAKTVKVTSYKTTSKSISKLTAKKKYYVRIRTYKKVGSKTFYSAWSSKKTVTTKK